jgi:ABC-2 type transport system ATP-binding protein
MIALEGVSARRAPLALAGVSLAWQAGAHAIVGGRTDGGPLLLSLLAGLARPRVGKVRVLDGAPGDPAIRRQIAFVPMDPVLPESLRVGQVLALAATLRKDEARDPARRLAMLGVEALVDRWVASLAKEEARAVALVEAVTSDAVRVVLVEEPLLAMDLRAAGGVPEALRARGRDGRTVVVSTASMRDACDIADDLVALRGGRVSAPTACTDALIEPGPEGVEMRVVLRDLAAAPALVAALVGEADVEAVQREHGAVYLRGRNASSLARAAGRAAIEADVELAELRIEGGVATWPRTTSTAPAKDLP